MRVEKKIKKFQVFSGDAILDALKQINENESRIVFVVEDNGVLIGALSDGDIRRWLTKSNGLDLNSTVDGVMNRSFIARRIKEPQAEIVKCFNNAHDVIPLVDDLGRFVAVALRSAIGFELGGINISDESPTFVIAEIGNNHQGDIERARELVDLALEAKVDCVKFQMRDLSTLYSNKGKMAEAGYDLGSQYTLDLLNKFQLSNDELCQVFDYCRKVGIMPLCTPWDLESVRVLDEYGLVGFKVASADLTNYEMLEGLAKTGKPLICSTGMSREAEIKGSAALLRKLNVQFALLHCNSTYPTPYKDVNLAYLGHLKKLAGTVVGYSGHERGISVPIAAVALGARIIEKHLTIDRNLEGNDHKVSLLPDEFAEMVRQIRNVEESMGNSSEREITQGEMINRENLAKSLVINTNLRKGEVIHRSMIVVKSPGQGMQPNRIDELIGKIALRDYKQGDCFFESDLTSGNFGKQVYKFTRPYGIPVRYHDMKELVGDKNLDFVEFHLSYHDLDVNLTEFFKSKFKIGYAVHSPELFARDHILDLASEDPVYLNNTIEQLKRTVDVTVELKNYFPSTDKPVLVLNAGGWSTHGFLPHEARVGLYERVISSLQKVELTRVRLAIQTMPPFPWHFGGQSYHNLFVDPDEIVSFCERTGYGICLDVSHSMMACNYYHWDWKEFLKKVLPYSIHIHVVDAKGVDGEGVQIGKGDVDFDILLKLMNEYAPGVQFIPEVWQGHKNKGEGFWSALDFLEESGF